MPEHGEGAYAFLLDTDSAEIARVVEEALTSAAIPHHSGVQSLPEPRIVFSVPEGRIREARSVVGQFFGAGPLARERDLEEPRARREEEQRRFPRGPVAACLALVVLHLGWVWAAVGPHPSPARLVAAGGLVRGDGLAQAWRLVTSLFVHSSPEHALWNGLSMLAFAVPLIQALGYARVAAIYLLAGAAGGLAALLACSGCVTVGSSGAVAGLFGAWLLRALREARSAVPAARARIKVVGIGLLVLPSLLSPTTATGARISVASHVGGALAGALLGLLTLRGSEDSPGSQTLVD